MHLRSPTFAFEIPSVHDGVRLGCRLYLPKKILQSGSVSGWTKRGAIVSHPYAPLGGCYDDPVVNFVGAELLRAGYVVGTFNFRGADGSEGRTSWTAKPELADYASFYGFMLLYLHALKTETTREQEPEKDGLESSQEFNPGRSENPSTGVHIILGGYSYGSLIASHLPAIDTVVDLFKGASIDTAPFKIRRIAEKLASCMGERQHLQTEAATANLSSSMKEDQMEIVSKSTVSYLLMSPLLPPLSQLLTIFTKLSLDVQVEVSAQGKHIPCPKPATQLRKHRTLVIYGTEDGFTSAKKLRKWSDELLHAPQSQFQYQQVEGAGHFWRENGVEEQARHALREWLNGMT
ncbi:hypothetical protein PHISCL_03439 [Aspergillus sclerotialis]|uniref:Uncharacterized protein n=1 Tax=Aspergillus sclerotialis TaxID=2070753 RepID=A0A3A2ZLY2_9EURO|nr:hypothetical protein PHISCL_03439 [Aspergillus sclerotialis]